MKAYPVAAIANEFLDLAWREGRDISPMKLQKLVYLAHGLNLALYGDPLIDSTVEAWKYGPVIAPLYYETRRYGSDPIRNPIRIESRTFFSDEPDDVPLDVKTRALLSSVWKAYGHMSAVDLSALTHERELPEGKPWYQTWYEEGGSVRWGTPIKDDVIRESFDRLLVPQEERA